MKRLCSAQHAGECLDRDAHDIVEWLLDSQRDAGCLSMEAELHRALTYGAEAVAHDARPDSSGSAILGNLFEEIVVGVEKEGNARHKFLDIEPCANSPVTILNAVAQRERQFLKRGRAGFANVIAADRNRVITGNMVGTKLKGVYYQLHRGADGIDPFL